MKEPKAILKKLLYPPAWLIIGLVVICTAALIAVFVNGWDTAPVAYAVYVAAFYTLTVVCMVCIRVFPRWYKAAKKTVYANQYGNRYMTDAAFKTHVSLYGALTVNLLYAATNVLSFFLYRSAWFAILAGYYTILAVMRFLLLRFFRSTGVGNDRMLEWRRSRLCGVILMTVNLTLSGAVLMILYENKGFEYHGILIYIMAMYTFYVTIHAIVNILKYRKYNSPVMITTKIISLSAALVSVLSLETAMLSQFGADTTPEFRRIMIAATGAGVSVAVIAMSVYTVLRATGEIRKMQQKE